MSPSSDVTGDIVKARRKASHQIGLAAQAAVTDLMVPQVVWGTVTAISTTLLLLTIRLRGSAGVTPGVRKLKSYTATVTDHVICLLTDGDLFCLGTIG